jgi:hypothetical protein
MVVVVMRAVVMGEAPGFPPALMVILKGSV